MGYTNIVSVAIIVLYWLLLAFFIYFIYKKQKVKPLWWVAIIIVLLGKFTFSFHWYFQDTMIKLPILPLGVWLIMLVFKIRRANNWRMYRPFAWLGFFSQFIFSLLTLLTIPIYSTLYPVGDLTTYFSKLDRATIVESHPSAIERTIDKNLLAEKINKMEPQEIHSDQWYEEMTNEMDRTSVKERFPYLLAGVVPKWGSGVNAVIYVEKDGKGLLITATKGQYYFRATETFFKESVSP